MFSEVPGESRHLSVAMSDCAVRRDFLRVRSRAIAVRCDVDGAELMQSPGSGAVRCDVGPTPIVGVLSCRA